MMHASTLTENFDMVLDQESSGGRREQPVPPPGTHTEGGPRGLLPRGGSKDAPGLPMGSKPQLRDFELIRIWETRKWGTSS